MCVACTLDNGQDWRSLRLGQWRLRYHIGGLRNFLPQSRGEGSPAPWLMIWRLNRFGIMLEAGRLRKWFRPEFRRDKRTCSFIWGFFMVAWRRTAC